MTANFSLPFWRNVIIKCINSMIINFSEIKMDLLLTKFVPIRGSKIFLEFQLEKSANPNMDFLLKNILILLLQKHV